MTPLRIAQIVTRRQRRGAEVFAADLCETLAARGHELSLVGLLSSEHPPLSARDTRNVELTGLERGRLDLRIAYRLAKWIDRHRPQVIQANGGYSLKYVVLARRLAAHRPPVLYCNIGLASDWLRGPIHRSWNRWLVRQADFVAAVSDASLEDIVTTYGVARDRIRVIRRGIRTNDTYSRDQGRRALGTTGIAESHFVMLHVGSFTPEKNHHGLLRIFARVRDSLPSARLVLVGDGPLVAEVRRASPAGVSFLGVRQDVPLLMAGADVLVLPSLTEGIPGVVLEAAGQAVPSVCYDVGGVREAVVTGETGLLVPMGSEEDVVRAMVQLESAPGMRARLGRGARNYICKEYDLTSSAGQFESVYSELLHA